MFDIGFSELLLICVIALLVVGPERLPKLARTAGLWVGKARRIVAEVRTEVERELKMEEVKQSVRQPGALEEMKQLAERVRSINADVRGVISDVPGPVTVPTPSLSTPSLSSTPTTPATPAIPPAAVEPPAVPPAK
jgi:sec-independent protein translocase protein TatB